MPEVDRKDLPVAEQKEMKTIIFTSASPENHLKSCETLNNACLADERCKHHIFFRPVMTNVFQWINGNKTADGKDVVLGNHEILYLPANKTEEIARLERTKNVVLKKNCMCFVGKDDTKVKNLINWLLEKTEEIEL